MRVVLDSSVVIAAFAARGLCQALFEHCLESHEILLGPEQSEEICRKLAHDIKVPEKITDEIASYLRIDSWPVSPAPVEPAICPGGTSLLALGVAQSWRVDYIITGAADLLALKEHRGAKIVDPRSFWSIMMNATPL